MERNTLYIALSQSTLVNSRKVHIKDISTLFCADTSITNIVGNIELMIFSNTEQDQVVITVMKLIELINSQYKNINIVNIGETETIVYYRNLKPTTKMSGRIKAVFVMILAFFGTGYSIMSYNNDTDAIGLLNKLYELFTGNRALPETVGNPLGAISYSIGLLIGMVIFFNHGINKKNTDDPTPLQVQMRLYEQDVNQCIIIDSERNNKTIDVS